MLRNSFFVSVTILFAVFMVGMGSVPVQSNMFVLGMYAEKMRISEEANVLKPLMAKEYPICSPNKRPHIDIVELDEVKPGDKMIVTGRFFGEKKECLYKVTIGSEEAKNPTYINEQKVEVTVPDSARPGMTFLNIQSGEGAARTAILVQHDK